MANKKQKAEQTTACGRWITMNTHLNTYLLPEDNTFNVKEIRCNAGQKTASSVQLLAIKPEIAITHTECRYKNKYKNMTQTKNKCRLRSLKNWAHFHVTSKTDEDDTLDRRHYLIVFVNRNKYAETKMLADIFNNTVESLQLKNVPVYFYIFIFGLDGAHLTGLPNKREITRAVEKNINPSKNLIRTKCYVTNVMNMENPVKKDEKSKKKPKMLFIIPYNSAEKDPYKFEVNDGNESS